MDIFSFQSVLSNKSLKMEDLLDQNLTAQILSSHVSLCHPTHQTRKSNTANIHLKQEETTEIE